MNSFASNNRDRNQPGLFDVAPDDANVQWLEGLLLSAKVWMTAADIEETCGGRAGDRDIRALASASCWVISGQRGYKHLRNATAEEASRCCHALESQAKKMGERAGRLRRNAHTIFG